MLSLERIIELICGNTEPNSKFPTRSSDQDAAQIRAALINMLSLIYTVFILVMILICIYLSIITMSLN